jgi:hypothetical protein
MSGSDSDLGVCKLLKVNKFPRLGRKLSKDESTTKALIKILRRFAEEGLEGGSLQDLAIELADRPGALAEMGEALARAGVSVEGGGAWVVAGRGVAHFLFKDGDAARKALEGAGIRVVKQSEVLAQRLKQDVPGQLGKLTRRMAEAGVNIEVLYSDHEHQMILVVDDFERGKKVSDAWKAEYQQERRGA